jgi:hypothetical protein
LANLNDYSLQEKKGKKEKKERKKLNFGGHPHP